MHRGSSAALKRRGALAGDAVSGVGESLETSAVDGLPAGLARAVAPIVQALEGRLGLFSPSLRSAGERHHLVALHAEGIALPEALVVAAVVHPSHKGNFHCHRRELLQLLPVAVQAGEEVSSPSTEERLVQGL